MKLTQQQLRQIIKEETQIALTREGSRHATVSKVSTSDIVNLIAEARSELDKVEAYMVNSGKTPAKLRVIMAQLQRASAALYKASYETDHGSLEEKQLP